MFFDPLYLVFMLPGLALALWAQARTRGAYQTYSDVRNLCNVDGARAARKPRVFGHVGDRLAIHVELAPVAKPFENLRARANAHDPTIPTASLRRHRR